MRNYSIVKEISRLQELDERTSRRTIGPMISMASEMLACCCHQLVKLPVAHIVEPIKGQNGDADPRCTPIESMSCLDGRS